MSHDRLALCGALLGLALEFTSCTGSASPPAAAGRGEIRAAAVARIVRTDLSRDLEMAAEFRPWQEIDVHAKVSGFVRRIYVDVGDRVSRGTLLAELEVPEMAQEIAQADATLRRTQLEVERAKGEVQRSEANLKLRQVSYERLAAVMKARPNLVAQQEIDDASTRFRESEAQLMTAKAALAVTGEQVRVVTATRERLSTMASYLRITAPFAGIVTRRLVDPGAMVQAGTASHIQALPVIRLSQVDHLRLILPVPESVVSRVRIGAPVEVRVDSLNRVFQGRISRFSGKLESSTRTMETEVDMPNPQHAILPGMYGYATLRLDQRHDTIAAPVQAISGHGAAASALVVSAGRIEERRVEAGLETPHMVEILSGLKEGELVVIGNRSQLRAGMPVEPKTIPAAELAVSH